MTERAGGVASYDAIADWYETYVTADSGGFTARSAGALRGVLGRGSGVCLDVACGTGVHAATLRELGWTPVGADISMGQLRHARGRMPVMMADAARLPIRAGSIGAVAAVACHTDMPDYAALCRAAARVLAPGGMFAHVGVHPCFIGAFADRSDPERVIVSAGYWRRERSFGAWSPHGVRARVGAVHLPLSGLLSAVIGAGLVVERVIEAGEPTPDVLAIRGRRPG